LSDPDAVTGLLQEIERRFQGYEIPAEPIRLVNYHVNCAI
jgi:hypothetical protein